MKILNLAHVKPSTDFPFIQGVLFLFKVDKNNLGPVKNELVYINV